ncbi:nonribosomal peptide synthase [Penicillium cinerascens]|uniref:Nonribosomal peptide synthase n=1 Tax=Penicillium cinerascens TaxID=70096 RepID=A0A9W9MMR2_9EURO|nr:nonribosomal peptide synthase [Penicillium cinerascens]KAJ5204206.1 nonribosomal peptide synthase [Penicillium cinerascens]
MTYRELETRAKALSLRLIQAGAGPEVVVPVLFEKSGWTPVAMLAVLFSGAAFVLLDSSFPDGRLKTMCEDTRATVGVCSAQYAARGASIGLKQVITPNIVHSQDSNVSLPQAVRPGNMAYVAFTSGSTGKPKGTVIEHSAFCTSAVAFGEIFRYTSSTRVLQFASYGFDASVGEVLGPLMAGGCVCVPSEQDRQQDLGNASERLGANFAFFTPAVLRTLNPDEFPSLSMIVCGGEKFTLNDIQPWAEQKIFMNAYGPSECSVFSSTWLSLSATPDTASIGYPTECHFWIVDGDDSNRLAPVGAVGELMIEGPIVGREYINRPEQSAQVFLRNPAWIRPFRTSPWTFYRTGDLVQLEPDGTMRILGRKDHQVKLHGQRIELGEIEHAIHEAFPELKRVIATVVKRASPVLVTFLLGADGNGGNQGAKSVGSTFLKPSRTFQQACQVAIDTHLRQRLPNFMIPKLWFPVDELPLTPNGKVDGRLLVAEVERLSPEEVFKYTLASGDRRTAAHDEMESRVQRWVAQALGVQQKQVALDASFFGQGGDSLAAMKASALARKEDINLSPFALQEAESLTILAKQLDRKNHSPIRKEQLVPQFIQDTDGAIQDALSCQVPGIRSVDIQHILAGTELQGLFLHLPCEYFRFELQGPLDVCRLQSAIQLLHERHEILRTVVFHTHRCRKTYQVVVREFAPQLEVLEGAQSPLWTADQWIFNDNIKTNANQRPLWPAARFFLAKKDAQTSESCLVIGIKHSHYDAISITTLLNDLATLYQHGPESLPPALSFGQYQAFAASLPISETIEFWRQALHGSSPFYVGRRRVLAPVSIVDASRTIPLVRPPPGITLATLVKTAWAMTLVQQSGKDDVVFAQIVSGRSQGPEGIQDVVGPCMNSIPVRVSLAGEKYNSLAVELMQAVQSQHVQSLFHETIDFTTLRDKCTKWGSGAWIETLVLHQNIVPDDEYQIGEASGKMEQIYPEVVTDEFILYSVPQAENHEFRLAVPKGVLDLDTVSHFVAETCHWVQTLAVHPQIPVGDLMLQRKADLDSATK